MTPYCLICRVNRQLAAWLTVLMLFALTPAWAGQAITSAEAEQWQIGINLNDTARLSSLLERHLQAGRRPDVRNRKGKTALMAAAAGKDPTLVKRLLVAGADPAAINIKGASTLIYAAWGGHLEILDMLLARAVPLEQAASNGWTAVMMASAKGHDQGLKRLLAAGARSDARDIYGWTPLMRASNLGRAAVVSTLISVGKADVKAFNTKGQTPLHLAAASEHQEIYRTLIAAGADPDQADFKGLTARAIALAVGID